MRNILLHAMVRGELDAAGALKRVVVAGHAYDVDTLVVTLQGSRGRVEVVAGAHPRTHQWVALFDDPATLREAGVQQGLRVRATAADMNDPQSCYSSIETLIEVD